MTNNDFKLQFTKALLYYIERIQLDLNYDRCDLLRHTIDPLCALANGFITEKDGGNLEGNHEKYKKNCYITHKAAEEKEELAKHIKAIKAENTPLQEKKEKIYLLNKKHKLHMEHVIPIKAIEYELISNKTELIQPENRKKLLNRLLALSIPCLVAMAEKSLLDKKEFRSKNKYLTNDLTNDYSTPWGRYVEAKVCPPIKDDEALPSNIKNIKRSQDAKNTKTAQDIIKTMSDAIN